MHDVLTALTTADAEVVIPAPGQGSGFWAGGPSAVLDDGVWWLAYRLRRPVTEGRGYANVIARSEDGRRFTTAAILTSEQFACASLERPALVRVPGGGWRVYVSCSTAGSKHWWVEAVDAPTVADLPTGRRTVVLPGDESVAWKDVVVRPGPDGWQMWACRHPLDGGDEQADRMTTWYATSADGLDWTLHGPALAPTAGTWNARGTRVTSVLDEGDRWWALYDARRSAEENWMERSGLAAGTTPGRFTPVAGPVPDRVGDVLRYVSLVPAPGGHRAYFERSAADGSHDLRTVYIPRPDPASQSE